MGGHGGEAMYEALELGVASSEARGGGHEGEVIDATILLEDPHVEFHRHAVELGREDGAHGLASIEREDRLRFDLALGEPHEEVLRERLERDVLAVDAAAAVDDDRRAVPFVAERERGV